MNTTDKTTITVETTVSLPVNKVWELWTRPEHITQWNFAAEDWHCPAAENDLRPGGRFSARMEARDGSMGFDYAGVYEEVVPEQKIVSRLGDDRRVVVSFTGKEGETRITETFDAENTNSLELQRNGWQAILNNFKKYAETRH